MADIMAIVEFAEDLEEKFEDVGVPRRIIRDAQNPMEFYTEIEFRKRYRFNKQTVLDILGMFVHNLVKETSRGLPVPPIIQLLIALRYYATGNFQMVSADLREVSQPTVSRIIRRISVLIAQKRPQLVKFPTRAECRHNAQQVYERSGFPGAVGAIDGTHIPILNPGGDHAEVFRNRKGVFSFNFQGIVTHQRKLIDFVTGWPGSTHDNRMFNNSRICLQFEQGARQGILVGDRRYACIPFLMTPVLRPTAPAEEAYSTAHILARNVVERTFGCWKKKFQCLSRKFTLKMYNIPAVIVATVVLHNIAADRGLLEEPDDREDHDDYQPPPRSLGAIARRNLIARHFQQI